MIIRPLRAVETPDHRASQHNAPSRAEPPLPLRKLPPLNALRSFEVAARCSSFTKAAAELLVTGRVIDASEGLRIGLLSRVVPMTAVVEEAMKIAVEISECGPQAVRQVLESMRLGVPTLDAALAREALCQSVSYQSAEFKEGVRAAIEKRKAKFSAG